MSARTGSSRAANKTSVVPTTLSSVDNERTEEVNKRLPSRRSTRSTFKEESMSQAAESGGLASSQSTLERRSSLRQQKRLQLNKDSQKVAVGNRGQPASTVQTAVPRMRSTGNGLDHNAEGKDMTDAEEDDVDGEEEDKMDLEEEEKGNIEIPIETTAQRGKKKSKPKRAAGPRKSAAGIGRRKGEKQSEVETQDEIQAAAQDDVSHPMGETKRTGRGNSRKTQVLKPASEGKPQKETSTKRKATSLGPSNAKRSEDQPAKKRKVNESNNCPSPPPLPPPKPVAPRIKKLMKAQEEAAEVRKELNAPPSNPFVGSLEYPPWSEMHSEQPDSERRMANTGKKSKGKRRSAAPPATNSKSAGGGADGGCSNIPSAKTLGELDHEEECCTSCSCRTAIKAAETGSLTLMTAVLADWDHIADPFAPASVDRETTCLEIALRRNDLKMVVLLLEYSQDPAKFVSNYKDRRVGVPEHTILSETDTGRGARGSYSRGVRKVNIARGGKEGNRALVATKEENRLECLVSTYWRSCGSRWPLYVVRNPDISHQLLEFLLLSPLASQFQNLMDSYNLTYHACVAGNHRVAAALIDHQGKSASNSNGYGGYGYNALHSQVLKTKAGESLPAFRKPSVLKKGPLKLTPLHVAAINPNSEVLRELLAAVDNDSFQADDNGRLPLHFAAACETPDNLNLLIKLGASVKSADKFGLIPLHLAAKFGRADNIKWLLEAQTSGEDVFDGTYHDKKGNTALAYAAYFGHVEAAKALVEWGAALEEFIKPSKMTALHLAAQQGHLGVVRLLIKKGARIDSQDKLKKTPLIYAAKNGDYEVCLELLRAGASVDLADSSGNAPAHYAAAYGYPNVLRLLQEFGQADLNIANLWKVTPLSIAVIKSHFLCIDYLLGTDGVDPHFKDDEGRSLIHYAAMNLGSNSVRLLKYVLRKNKDLLDQGDADGHTALHHLCRGGAGQAAIPVLELLLSNGANINAASKSNSTPLILALASKNLELASKLLDNGARVDLGTTSQGQNTLHAFFNALSPQGGPTPDMISTLWQQLRRAFEEQEAGHASLETLARAVDNAGNTPILTLIKALVQRIAQEENVDPKKQIPIEKWMPVLQEIMQTIDWQINAKVQREKSTEDEELSASAQVSSATYSSDEDEDNDDLMEEEEDGHVDGDDLQEGREKAEEDEKAKEEERQRKKDENQETLGCTALHFCCSHDRNLPLVVYLLNDCKADLDTPNYRNETPLFLSLTRQAKLIAQELLNHEADVNVSSSHKKKLSPLHVAAGSLRDLEILESICRRDAAINVQDENGATPLMLAVEKSKEDPNSGFRIERILLRYGADINAKDKRSRTCLHYAFTNPHSLPNSQKLVAPRYYWQSSNKVEKDPIDIVSDLCNVDGINLDLPDKFGRTPLHYAAETGALISSLYLLQRGAQVNILDCHQNSPFAIGVIKGHANYAVMLLNNGADLVDTIYCGQTSEPSTKNDEPFKLDLNSESLFKLVLSEKYMGLAYIMMDKGVNVLAAVEDALDLEQYQMVLTLLSKTKKQQLQMLSEDGKGLYHILACHSPKASESATIFGTEFAVRIASDLFDFGVDVKQTDNRGNSPLHYSAKNLHPSLSKFFIDKGAALELCNGLGETPLVLACRSEAVISKARNDKKFQTVEVLVEAGARITLTGESCKGNVRKGLAEAQLFLPLLEAVKAHDKRCVKYLQAKGGDICEPEPVTLKTSLMLAIEENDSVLIKLLLKDKRKANTLVKLADAKGWTAVHYAVQPLPLGSFENVQLLPMLKDCGAPLDVGNKEGKTAWYYAARQCSGTMLTALEKLGAKASKKDGPSNDSWPSLVLPPPVSLDSDAKATLRRLEEKEKAKRLKLKPEQILKQKVDELCNRRERYHVVLSEGVEYNVTLNKTDVAASWYGRNDFYVLQVLEEESREQLVILLTRWGRIGERGEHQETPFPDKQAAIHEFKKIFQSKTGNAWDNRENFEFKNGKYNLVRKLPPKEEVDFLIPFGKNLALPDDAVLRPSVQKLMRTVSECRLLKETLRETNYNLPFGAIHNENLRKAMKYLEEISAILDEKDAENASVDGKDKIVPNPDVLRSCTERITKLSNLFYTFVPQGAESNRIFAIQSRQQVNEKIQMLMSLSDIHTAGKLILGALHKPKEINPYEYLYRGIGVGLEALSLDNPMRDMLSRYWRNTSTQNTRDRLELVEAFQVERPGEMVAMKAHLTQRRMLLWHGSPLGNMIGILKNGLQIAPAIANESGSMFGKGIYFADCFEKSFGYMRFQEAGGSAVKNYACMLLCEVAVGSPDVVSSSAWGSVHGPAKGYDSVQAEGKTIPSPEKDLVLQDGVILPFGQLSQRPDKESDKQQSWTTPYMPYNEYIVYDSSRVRLRYVLFFKANGWTDPEKEE